MSSLLALLVGLVLAITSALSEARSDYDEFERYRAGVELVASRGEGLGVDAVDQGGEPYPLPESVRRLIDEHFPAEARGTAACIVWRESGGDVGASSSTDDHGLWQIHRGPDRGWEGWGAYFVRVWNEWRPFDAEWATRAARHIWERAGRSFSPWTTAEQCGA